MDKITKAPPVCQLHNLCGGFCESERGVQANFCEKCLEVNDQHWARAQGTSVSFGYTNYRGEHSLRRATPIRFEFGSTEHHQEPQWLMHAIDHDKGAIRAFALKDITFVDSGKEPLSEEVVRAKFEHWDTKERIQQPPYSTISMRKERSVAFAAGIAAALGQKR